MDAPLRPSTERCLRGLKGGEGSSHVGDVTSRSDPVSAATGATAPAVALGIVDAFGGVPPRVATKTPMDFIELYVKSLKSSSLAGGLRGSPSENGKWRFRTIKVGRFSLLGVKEELEDLGNRGGRYNELVRSLMPFPRRDLHSHF